jgi:hypothetical protein
MSASGPIPAIKKKVQLKRCVSEATKATTASQTSVRNIASLCLPLSFIGGFLL